MFSPTSSIVHMLRGGPLKITVVGSGNWGSVITRLVALNAKTSYIFYDTVRMWVFEELFEGQKLTDIINSRHENPKYLPGVSLPETIIAMPDIVEACKDADLLIFVMPHQFIVPVCESLKKSNAIKRTAKAISLIKGLYFSNFAPVLCSNVIRDTLGIDCCVLSGANVAKNVANEEFCETSIGYKNKEAADMWQQLFDTPYFKVNAVPDVNGIEVCGAVKNVIALAAGFCDGMNLGTNTKSAIIRLGVEELKAFANLFFDGIVEETFFDSAGYADVITTCFGGRNVRCAAEFVRCGGAKTWEQIEEQMLNGQKLQGHLTCKELQSVLAYNGLTDLFPLFNATYEVAFLHAPPDKILNVFMQPEPRQIKGPSECNSCIISEKLIQMKRKIRGEI